MSLGQVTAIWNTKSDTQAHTDRPGHATWRLPAAGSALLEKPDITSCNKQEIRTDRLAVVIIASRTVGTRTLRWRFNGNQCNGQIALGTPALAAPFPKETVVLFISPVQGIIGRGERRYSIRTPELRRCRGFLLPIHTAHALIPLARRVQAQKSGSRTCQRKYRRSPEVH